MNNPVQPSYIKDLKQLGETGKKAPSTPSEVILEAFPKPSEGEFYVTFYQDGEFSSLCPKTGQPDFADIHILYKPDKVCVESKSLKLYLQSYRDVGGFGEDITNRIADDLNAVLKPKFIIVKGNFKPRGGIGWITDAIRLQTWNRDTPIGITEPYEYSFTELDKIAINNFK